MEGREFKAVLGEFEANLDQAALKQAGGQAGGQAVLPHPTPKREGAGDVAQQ